MFVAAVFRRTVDFASAVQDLFFLLGGQRGLSGAAVQHALNLKKVKQHLCHDLQNNIGQPQMLIDPPCESCVSAECACCGLEVNEQYKHCGQRTLPEEQACPSEVKHKA